MPGKGRGILSFMDAAQILDSEKAFRTERQRVFLFEWFAAFRANRFYFAIVHCHILMISSSVIFGLIWVSPIILVPHDRH